MCTVYIDDFVIFDKKPKRYPWGELIEEDDDDSNADAPDCSGAINNGDTSVEVGE